MSVSATSPPLASPPEGINGLAATVPPRILDALRTVREELCGDHKWRYSLLAVGVTGGLVTAAWVAATRRRRGRVRDTNVTRIIDTIPELQQCNVYIRDRDRVEDLVCQLIKEGKDRLQTVIDFDMTLTKYMVNGKRNPTSYGVIDCSPSIKEEFRQRFHTLRNTYYPIEIAPDLSIAQKTPYMVEWWTNAHKLLLECDLTKDKIRQMVATANTQLRDGSDLLFSSLSAHEVPLLIFSAGVGDVLEEVIRQQLGDQQQLYNNMKIVSNYLEYTPEGRVVGFRGKMIHIYNKNESAIHESDYFGKLRSRHNIILIGDSLGDLRMADGATDHNHIMLTIGFLNDKIEHRLAEFMNKFDIVLCQDETMDVPNALLKRIL